MLANFDDFEGFVDAKDDKDFKRVDLTGKTLGELADDLYVLADTRKNLKKKVDFLSTEETRIKDLILTMMSETGVSGVLGGIAKVAVKEALVPRVEDWSGVYAYILEHKDFSLLSKSAIASRFRELWEHGVEIDGVVKYSNVTLSCTKTVTNPIETYTHIKESK